jgi:hypothetical protein
MWRRRECPDVAKQSNERRAGVNWDHIEGKWNDANWRFGKMGEPGALRPHRIAEQKGGYMRTRSVLGLMILVVGLGGCMIVEAPIKGVLGTEVIWGDMATGEHGSETRGTAKQGKACADSILGLIARGDASVRAAKENGGITEVTSVDHSARNFLNIVGEWCTLVRGK